MGKGIPRIYCACGDWEQIPVDSDPVLKSVEALVAYMNKNLEKDLSACQEIEPTQIEVC
jgi:hypothetical protein